VQATDGAKNVALVINLDKSSCDVRNLGLDVTRILQQVAKREKHISLHAPNDVGDLLVRGAARPELSEGVPDAGVGLVRMSLSALYRTVDPATEPGSSVNYSAATPTRSRHWSNS
jgi:hypothetical protein